MRMETVRLVFAASILSACQLLGAATAASLEEEAGTEQLATPDTGVGQHLVYVNQANPAYTLFQSIPSGTAPETIENVKQRVANHEKAYLVSWDDFVTRIGGYVEAAVERNDYPKFDMDEVILCLVQNKPGWPWGLTWNGGLAFTRNDFDQAARRYAAYGETPEKYRRIRDAKKDPNHPNGFLRVAGCQ